MCPQLSSIYSPEAPDLARIWVALYFSAQFLYLSHDQQEAPEIYKL